MKTRAILLMMLFALGVSAGAAEKKTSWKITGQLEESCSCNAACPCWFDSLPTRTTCSGNQVLFIKRGRYGKVSLNGLAVGNVVQSPDNQTMMQSFGKWNFSYLYVDARANAQQREALEAIGRTVLPLSGATKIKVRVTPITREISGDDHKITLGNYGSFRGHLAEGGLGGVSKLVNPPGADPLHAQYLQGHASSVTYRDAGQDWHFKGTNYMRADFTINSTQYEKYQAGLAQKMAGMKKAQNKS